MSIQKKQVKKNGPAVVGIQLKHENDLQPLIKRMKKYNFYSDYINSNESLLISYIMKSNIPNKYSIDNLIEHRTFLINGKIGT